MHECRSCSGILMSTSSVIPVCLHLSWVIKCSPKKHQATNVGSQVSGYGNKWIRGDGETTRITRKQVQKSVDDSLQRLNTDYVDLLQVSSSDSLPAVSGYLALGGFASRQRTSYKEPELSSAH